MRIETETLSVRLGRREILRHVSLTAQAGQITAIVGPNGSGKTTFLRAISGDLPFTGRALLNGKPIAGADPADLAMARAVLAQFTSLAFPFTVLEAVRIGLVNGGGDSRAMAALTQVGLSQHAGRMVQDLSGGEQARVHLARVLVQVWEPVGPDGPRWLFLDEPVASLDIGQQLAVMRLARSFADQGGGVIAIMHDLNLSAIFADRIALFHDGQLLAAGLPRDVLTDQRLSQAYGCDLRVNTPPAPGIPWLLPQAAPFA